MLEHIIPYMKKQRQNLSLDPQYPALLIMDVFKGQMTKQVKYLLNENNIKQGQWEWYFFLAESLDIALGLFISKIIKQQYRFQAKKESLSVFGGQHHKKLKMTVFWKMDQKITSFTYNR